MEAGYTEKVDEWCDRYSLDRVLDIKGKPFQFPQTVFFFPVWCSILFLCPEGITPDFWCISFFHLLLLLSTISFSDDKDNNAFCVFST